MALGKLLDFSWVECATAGGVGALFCLGELLGEPGDLDHYCEVFGRTGFAGGINWYRNIDQNAAEHPAVGTVPLALPCLMLTAEWDPGLRPEYAEGMRALCADLELHPISAVAHWMQQEAADLVNGLLIGWLTRVEGRGLPKDDDLRE